MRKLLVTGGAGFIGSNFIRYWLEKYPEDKILNLDLLTYAGNLENLSDIQNNENYEFVKGDICNFELVDFLMKEFQPDFIVNFAAESHNSLAILNPTAFFKTNVIGTQTILEAARKNNIKRFHHISCYDEKTRAFTKGGLKEFNQIKKGDLVLSINTSTQEMEWKPIEELVIQDYNGKMIKMKSKTTDFLVTPNHRMLVQSHKDKKLFYKIAEDMKKEVMNKLPKHYSWKGEVHDIIKEQKYPEEFMYILGIFIGDGYICYQEKKNPSKTGLRKKEYTDMCRDKSGKFMSSVEKIGNEEFFISKSWRIFLDIPHTDKLRKRCEKSLDRLCIKWKRYLRNDTFSRIYFNSEKFTKIFADCGKHAKNKKIPEWALDAPQDLLKPLLQGLLDSDGNGKSVFITSSDKLAEQYMELCIKLGLSPSIKRTYRKSTIEGREIFGFANVISFGEEWRSVRKEIITEEDYKGKIWCLKVKDNKNFLVERNGKTAFCGNTCEVYGDLALDSQEKFTEKTPYNPNTPYNASKAAADLAVKSYFRTFNLPVTISNCANNYGPYQFPEKLIPLFISNLIEEKKVPLYKSSQNKREWIHVLDHCKAIDLILQKGKPGEVYNIGTGFEKSVEEITSVILKNLDQPESMKEYVPDRPSHDRRYLLDSSKIMLELGWKPKVDFEKGMEETVKWYKNNEQWWRPLKQKKLIDETKWKNT